MDGLTNRITGAEELAAEVAQFRRSAGPSGCLGQRTTVRRAKGLFRYPKQKKGPNK
jgi:hypothetical protein